MGRLGTPPNRGDALELWAEARHCADELAEQTFDGLWAALRREPTQATVGRYFRWVADAGVSHIATQLIRVRGDQAAIGRAVAPGNLQRLPHADRLLRAYYATVAAEFRRQQSAWDFWAAALGLYGIAGRLRGQRDDVDPTGGFDPHFQTKDVLAQQQAIYEAAGQYALLQLGADPDLRFIVSNDAVRRRVDQLLLDQIDGIDQTTTDGLKAILANDQGLTVAELGQAIADYWDQATLVRGLAIAVTEMARAAAGAELDTYGLNGVEKVEFSGFPSGDECDGYLGNEYSVDSVEAQSLIPVHTRCTHYWSPVLPTDWGLPATPWAGGDVSGIDWYHLPDEVSADFAAGADLAEALDWGEVLPFLMPRSRSRAPREYSSAIVGFFLSRPDAEALALPGGEDPGDLHLTLAFLGDSAQYDLETVLAIRQALARFSEFAEPIAGMVNGVGRFLPPPGEPHPIWASYDAPAITALREVLVGQLINAGARVATDHGFIPHITLAYVEPTEAAPLSVPRREIGFSTLTLALAGERIGFPLGRRTP